MSAINGVGNPDAPGPIQKIIQQPIHKEIPATASSPPRSGVDKLELSGVSHLLKALKSSPDARIDKVQQIRSQIAAGNYPDDDEKLDIAADRLLDELQHDRPDQA